MERLSRRLAAATRILWIAAVIALAVALHGHRRSLSSYRAREALLHQGAVRLAVMDRWLGGRLPAVEVTEPSGRAVSLRKLGRGRIVWWIDVRRCVGCLGAHLEEWESLQRYRGVRGVLVLGGTGAARGIRVVRKAGIRTPVAFDPDGRVGATIGTGAASVLLGSDAEGVIVSADAQVFGSGDSRCGWAALRKVAAVHGRSAGERPLVFTVD